MIPDAEETKHGSSSRSLEDRIANGPWDWELAEDIRRDAALKMTPLDRLEVLEEILDMFFMAQEHNPHRAIVNSSVEGVEPEE